MKKGMLLLSSFKRFLFCFCYIFFFENKRAYEIVNLKKIKIECNLLDNVATMIITFLAFTTSNLFSFDITITITLMQLCIITNQYNPSLLLYDSSNYNKFEHDFQKKKLYTTYFQEI